MSNARERINDLVEWFVAEGVREGVVPPCGALTLTVSDGQKVLLIEATMQGEDIAGNGDMIVAVDTRVRVTDGGLP